MQTQSLVFSQLENKVGFIGKISDDDLGVKYEEGLKKEKSRIFLFKKGKIPTGTCLILITPDSERTMVTFLGTAGKDWSKWILILMLVKESELLFLEGYLWDEGEPRKAFDQAIKYSNKVAMSLSDLFVERHKPHFLELVQNNLDVTFANEQEIMTLIDAKKFEDVIEFSKKIKKLIVITRGQKGALAIKNEEVFECSAKENLNIVDLTGAGDLFAGGFLHEYVNGKSLPDNLEKGTEMSSKIIQKIGARLN